MRGVQSVSFLVLFNGARTSELKLSRAIRQGDPISSYLFLLATEGLSCLLKNAMQNELLSSVKVAKRAPKVNHLFG
jgi:hypothetical protein